MPRISFHHLCVVFALFGSAHAVHAATATTTFNVKLTVGASCTVAATDIDFGTVNAAVTADLSKSGTLSVRCQASTSYTLGLAPSTNDTTGAGTMKGATGTNTDTVGYQLRQTSATGPAWGNVIGTNTATGTGSGMGNTTEHTVYATVPTTDVMPDAYSDVVTVTLTY